MKEWISANGGALAFVIVGVSVGGYQNDRVGLFLICFGVVWWAASRVRRVGRYLPRVRVTWVPADQGWLRRRRAENVEERAVRLAQTAQLEPTEPKTPETQPTPKPVPQAKQTPTSDTPVATKPAASASEARTPVPVSELKPHEAARERAENLLKSGQVLMDELLRARRRRTASPLGNAPAVAAVARQIREWNESVGQEVDGSPLSFNQKIALRVYQEQPLTEVFGPSPERLAAVLENNMGLLHQVVRAHSHG